VQPLMACDTLGYQYTGDGDSLRMLEGEVDDDDVIDRLGRIFKDMLAYTPCPVPEYSAARPPNEVSSRTEVGYSSNVLLAGQRSEVRLRAGVASSTCRDPG
jgi:hypothetical protein